MENSRERRRGRDVPAIQTAQTETNEEQYEIDLLELFYRLIENVKYIIAAAMLGAVLAWLYTTLLVEPLYTATSKLYLINTGSTVISVSDLQIGNYLASDYQEVFKNWHVHDMVIDRLNLPYSYKQLSSMVSVTNPSNTRVLYIRVTSPSPDEAKLMADTYAEVAKEFISTTMDAREPNVFEEALKPTSPSSPSKRRNLLIGFVIGFLIACGIITIRYLMDDKIHSSEDIEKYINLPCLGMLPMQNIKTVVKQKRQHKKGGAGV